MTDELEDFLDTDGVEGEQLRQILIRAMIHYANNRPRSLQQHIGPSQAGTTCTRKLAYAINAEAGPNNYTDPLPSMIGTAMHATMEEVMALKNAEEIRERQLQERKLSNADLEKLTPPGDPLEDPVAEVAALLEALKEENTDLGYVRWLTETKVTEPIPGTCDLFDRDTGTVIDYKFLGPTTHKKYSTSPSDDYQTQVHLYGAGLVARGEDVKNVAIFMVPRSGKLRNAVLWIVPFDPERALRAVRLFVDLIAHQFIGAVVVNRISHLDLPGK